MCNSLYKCEEVDFEEVDFEEEIGSVVLLEVVYRVLIQTGKGGIDGGSVYQLCVCMYIPCGDFSACSSAYLRGGGGGHYLEGKSVIMHCAFGVMTRYV